ncbi:MAG: dipeptidase [Planctomycetota bacterium]
MRVFDGHNDVLLSLMESERGHGRSFFEASEHGHLDLPRAREGGFAGGFFAVFVPGPKDAAPYRITIEGGVELDMPSPITSERAVTRANVLAGLLHRLAAESEGGFEVVRTVGDIERCFESETVAAILHFEGAEPLDPGLDSLPLFYEAGLRSLGIVWSRRNAFGHGVPFRCPQSPDVGPGLTDAGCALVGACNELGILIDLAHLNARGFWDVAERSNAPLVVTHACAHALCPSARNLTDDQLDAVAQSGGVVGVNFYVGDLREDGRCDPETPIRQIVHHIDYMVERMGIDHVAFGSDFDGATMPSELGDVTGLPKLIAELRDVGYRDDTIEKLAHANWLRVLDRTWQ